MKLEISILLIFLCSLNALGQKEEFFTMKKAETGSISVDKKLATDSNIDLSSIGTISSLAISGKIKLIDNKSLVRVILLTKAHEYLVFEAYPLIVDKLDFSLADICEETSLLNNEEPLELVVIVRNAEFEFRKVHFSNIKLNDGEKNGFLKLKEDNKKRAEKYKCAKINNTNSKAEKTWYADTTEISVLPFEKKKIFFGSRYDFITDGYEYYSAGIFSFSTFNTEKNTFKSVATSSYPISFDWRNRHGQNWMTSIKLQGNVCGACCAFASVAVAEIMTNLYFNTHIDVDLSEQELVSCASMNCSGCTDEGAILAYIGNNTICNESCFPYSASNEFCSNKCPSPNERIGFSSVYSVGSSETSIKEALIFKGPAVSTICIGNWCHAMALIGYNVIQQGDYIRRLISGTWTNVVIQSNDPLIGQTYWIFKNSYQSGNAGYHYIFFNNVSNDLSIGGAINTPMTSLIYSENDRVCVDNDGDGYYNWGIGSKPSTCPVCTPDQPDGDDSNPNLGPMDDYGNLSIINQPFLNSEIVISTIENWLTDNNFCADVTVTNDGNLTINGAAISLQNNSTLKVEIGGELLLVEGSIF